MERIITEKEFKEFTSEIITGLVSVLIDDKNYEDLGTYTALVAAAFEMLRERIFDGREDTDEKEVPKVSCESKKRKIVIEEADEEDLPDWLKDVLDTIAEQVVKGTMS